jgi:hypothetical protein
MKHSEIRWNPELEESFSVSLRADLCPLDNKELLLVGPFADSSTDDPSTTNPDTTTRAGCAVP